MQVLSKVFREDMTKLSRRVGSNRLKIHFITLGWVSRPGSETESGLCWVSNKPASKNKPVIICEQCDGEYHLHCVEPKLKAVPEGDFICVYCRQANAFSKLARRSNLPKKQFIANANANADEVSRSKRYIGKDISRNMAGFPEPLLGRIDSYHSDGSYKIVYNPTGAIERVVWEELYVILKHMEEEVQIKCIAEEDRKENIDAALEALEVKK